MKNIAVILSVFLALSGITSADEMFSDRLIQSLCDRSDLIVDATLVESCQGGMAGGPISTEQAQITFLGCNLRVKINRVLKGECETSKPFYIWVTIPFSDKGPIELPQKGERFIYFLEDRPKREPNSQHSVGNQIVRFRSFDLWLWRLPVSEAMVLRFSR